MTISIIIPAFQREAFLSETVRSVLQSGLPLEEVLLIDDGSTDGTVELCDRLAEENLLVRCIHKKNGGVSSARNVGIVEAKGDYLWFVDSDDTVCPLPEELFKKIDESKPELVIFGMTFDYWDGGAIIRQEDFCPDQGGLCTSEALGDSITTLFQSNSLSSACNKLFLRENLVKEEFRFREDLINYEDLEFVIRCLSACNNVLICSQSFYHYRLQNGKDRTVERIARIPDLMGNTDRIADAFFYTAEALHFSPTAREQLRDIVFALYLNLFQVRLLTAPFNKLGQLCDDLATDERVRQCEDALERLPASRLSFYRNIIEKKTISLWLRGRYLRFRGFAAHMIKSFFKRT